TTLTVPAAGLLANDTDVERDRLAAVLVQDVAHGQLTLNADGSFTYRPDDNYNGPDSFTYKVNDSQADGNTATVSITVNPVTDRPVGFADASPATEDTPLDVTATNGVLANDTDVDGDPRTAVPVSGPSHGRLTLNPDGSFGYTPEANFNGPD